MSNFVWDFHPEIFNLGSYSPRWYGLCFATGIVLGNAIFTKMFRDEGRDEEILSTLLVYIVMGTIIGARLGHCLMYEPDRYLSNPLEILNLREGGLASHGGFLGVLIAMGLFLRKHPIMSFLELSDRMAMPGLLAGGFIRIGNFFNSEMYGPPTTQPWGIIFRQIDNQVRHPSMLYEASAYLGISAVLYYLFFYTNLKKTPGKILGATFIMGFTARLLIEFIKVDQVAFEAELPLNMGQLLSIPFITIGLMLFFRNPKGAQA